VNKEFALNKCFFNKNIILCLILGGCLTLLPSIQAEGQLRDKVGGSCRYKTYSGNATIISINKTIPDDTEGNTRFEVKFNFNPATIIEENFAQVKGKTFYLYDDNLRNPNQTYLEKYNIKIGQVLGGHLLAITQGTCTPVIFDFPLLKAEK
jgi:hypothetical protein